MKRFLPKHVPEISGFQIFFRKTMTGGPTGWEKNVEDGGGVRAMEAVLPETDETNSASCKERGNWHFRRAEYDDALAFYTKAIKLNQGGKKALNVFHKNRAACYIKLENYEYAVNDSTSALGYDPNDSKERIS